MPVTAEFGPDVRARATAIRLADGRLLSASHVLDEAGIAEGFCRLGRPGPPPRLTALALADGRPAARLRSGEAEMDSRDCELAYRGGTDLALLAEPGPRVAGAAPCAADTTPGQAVIVATRARMARARMAGEAREADPRFGRYAVLPMRLEPGESGGGVFDAATRCLAGIVSQRALDDPGAAWIVPASTIRAFLERE
ncbi:hypothetical protein EOD42_11415 [Rhodovarius crocodyli]|uniref:Serine protease n=1 Tax=Rhodovarius crocodyli TaxID=1979269 RepID=A0A437MH87_9PROT|nr:trypsin-like peptidase domain-containing protein [Rhodovarius crocodyli]RVT96996.1 hypothetical protein EOD42_11415 [Rhodovarius crocodyli]